MTPIISGIEKIRHRHLPVLVVPARSRALRHPHLRCPRQRYLPMAGGAVLIDRILLLAGQNVKRVVTSGTINLRGEDLGLHPECVDGHDRRYNEETKRNQEKVRDGNEHTQHGAPKTFERHHPRSFNTSLLAELKHLHSTVCCCFIVCREYLSGMLGGVMHGLFVALALPRFL